MKCLDWLVILLVLILILGTVYALVYGIRPIDFSHIIYLGI
jgi:hypothetical protein